MEWGDEVPSEIIRSQHIQNVINNKPNVELDPKNGTDAHLKAQVFCVWYACASPARLADTFDTA